MTQKYRDISKGTEAVNFDKGISINLQQNRKKVGLLGQQDDFQAKKKLVSVLV